MKQLKSQQKNIIEHERGNLLVSASGGSGKTFVMIRRLARLIAEGKADVNSVLVVTFTEKAAEEMKSRITARLIEEAQEGSERLKRQLLALPSADITTIDSFCMRLIKTYFFKAEIPADFSVMDEDQADNLQEEVLNEMFEEKYLSREEDFLLLSEYFTRKRNDEHLKRTVKSLHSKFSTDRDYDKAAKLSMQNFTEIGFEKIKARYKQNKTYDFIRYSQKLTELSAFFRSAELNAYADKCDECVDLINVVLHSDIYSLYDRLSAFSFKIGKGNKRNVDQEDLDQAKKGYEAIKKVLKQRFDEIKDDISDGEDIAKSKLFSLKRLTEILINTVKEFSERYSQEKLKQGSLDFNDIERYALKVLSDEEVRKAVAAKYRYVFVDEYQDVNDMQDAIISAVSDNNLFTVGDVKQSIYRFRGCDSTIFAKKQRSYGKGEGTFVSLNYNFRSADAVINFVNDVFSYCMTEETGDTDYKNTAKLTAGGGYDSSHYGEAVMHIVPKPEREPREVLGVYDIIEESKITGRGDYSQENAVADIVKSCLGKTYFDPDSGDEKVIGTGDIVILLRSFGKNTAGKLVTALSARGIPLCGNPKENLLDFPEVETVNALTLLLANKNQDIPLAICLKNLFYVSDAELALIRSAYGIDGNFYQATQNYANQKDDLLAKKLSDVFCYIERERVRADYLPAGEIIEEILAYTKYKERLLLEPLGRLKVGRIERFTDLSYGNGKAMFIPEFLQKLSGGRIKHSNNDFGHNDAVRLMSMHSSKGLEFPVVIIPYLNKMFNFSDARRDVFTDDEFGVVTEFYDKENLLKGNTILVNTVKDNVKHQTVTDEMRLLYVALTRAKYSLHIVCDKDTRTNGDPLFATNMFSFIPENLPAITESPVSETGETARVRTLALDGGSDELKEKILKNISFVYPYAEATAIPVKTSVTATLKYLPEEGVAQVFVDGESAKEAGIAAHKVMENIDFYAPFDKEAERIKSGVMDDEQLRYVDLSTIKNTLKLPVFSEIKDYTKYREKPFIAKVTSDVLYGSESAEPVLLQGVIDLLAVKDGKAIIVDYKYSGRTIEALKEEYSKQLEIYSYAVSNVLGLKVEAKYIVNLKKGEQIKID